jgi:small subunit ribosomal protein S11
LLALTPPFFNIDKKKSMNTSPTKRTDKKEKVSPGAVKKRMGYKKRKTGYIFVTATRNNTVFTLANRKGEGKGVVSAGAVGFKNSRKSTSVAAEVGASKILEKAETAGFQILKVKMKGIGFTKLKAVRALENGGLPVVEIEEKTTRPHNGCRLSRKRRV